MKKIRAIAVAMAMSVFLSGCYDYVQYTKDRFDLD